MADIPAPPPGFTLDAAPPPPPPPPGFKLAAPPPPPGFKLDAAAAGGPTAPGGFKLEVREPTLPDQIRSFADTYLTPSSDRPPIKTAGDLVKAFGADLADVGKTLTKPMVKGVADLLDYAHGGLEPGKDISDEAKAALSMFASKTPGRPPVAGAEAAAEMPKQAPEAPPAAPPPAAAVPPPPAPGFVRFYHGGQPYAGGARWLSDDPKYAQGYADKQRGGIVSYVDIPQDSPLLQKQFDDTGTSQKSPYVHFEAPPEIAKDLKPLAPPAAGSQLAATPEPKPDAPGPIIEPPKLDETTKQTAQRIDDGLFRLRKNDTADKIEAKRFLDELPKETLNRQFQEKVYTEIERRMADPQAKYSPDVQSFMKDHLEPMKREELDLANEIRQRLGKDAEGADIPPLQGEGYVHLVVQGKGTPFDRLDPEAQRSPDPVMGSGRTLSKFASGLQPRKFWVLEGPDGTRVFQPKPGEWEVGQAIRGSDGKIYRPKLATTEEIEANTPVRYYKNAVANTIDNVLRLKRIKRNLDLLDEIKPQLLDRDLMVSSQGNRQAPPNFIKTTLPQFQGMLLDPRIAHVLNDFHGELQRGGDLAQIGAKINRFLTGSLFWTPIPHAANVLNHWIVGRGWDWMTPGGWRSLMKEGTRAIRAVVTQNDDYVRMLREGSGILYGDVANQNFYKLMLEKAFREQVEDPQTWAGIARNLGFGTVKDMVKAEYRWASKMLWAANDVFMLQRQFELMGKGMDARRAIAEAEKDIPNYRVPSEVMGKRWISEAIQNPNLFMFGRYKYGQFRAYSEMIKDLVKGGTEGQRKDAIGKLLVLGIIGLGAYPLASAALRKVTGNQSASIMPSGPFSIPSAAIDLAQGQRDWMSFMSSVVTPAPTLEILRDVTTNRDVFGRPIIEPQSSPMGKAVQAGEYAAGRLGPVEPLLEATRPGGAASAVGRQFRAKLPSPQSERGRAVGRMIERRQATKRESKDKVERWLKDTLGVP
jgi:hypothetical protein